MLSLVFIFRYFTENFITFLRQVFGENYSKIFLSSIFLVAFLSASEWNVPIIYFISFGA